MADFSHEMKTPMTSIIGYADLLRSQVLTPDEQMDAANYIFSEGKRLEALGLKLLDMLSLDQSKLQLVPASPADLVAGLLEHLKRVYAQKGIALQYRTAEGMCFLEPDLFKTLLVNLMDNARKALDSGGNIYVWQERYSRAVERLAREENVPLVDVRGAFLDYGHLEQTLCADGTHPNTVGQGLITKAFQDFGRGLRLAGQTV